MNKIKINQNNYNYIIDLAKSSNSMTDLCKKLGWEKNTTKFKQLAELLKSNGYDFSLFPKEGKRLNFSVFNNKEKLQKITLESNNYSEILRKFEIKPTGRTLTVLKKYLSLFELSVNHFDKTKRYLNPDYVNRWLNEEIFIENSPVATGVVKDRIIKEQIFAYFCEECGNTGEWRGKKMTLQLEHKNGNNRDHRLENLCFLCPNCHSITETWGARNIKKVTSLQKKEVIPRFMVKIERDKEHFLNEVIKQCDTYSDILKYYSIVNNTDNKKGLKNFLMKNQTAEVSDFLKHAETKKITYPPIEELLKMITTNSFVHVGKQLGCSDNAIRKHLKKHGVDYKIL
jgi:predicted RNA-binding Zn-ribbon protein involved in translation (DUF1610 family)